LGVSAGIQVYTEGKIKGTLGYFGIVMPFCKGKPGMDVSKILEELNAELERVKLAIESLEELSHGGAHRPGRPAAGLTEAKRHGRPPDDEDGIAEVPAPGGDTAAA
jgi:hypothetical protein